MLFNSINFIILFFILFVVYYFIFKEKTKLQNILLLIAGYIFYGWTDWKILPLLIISTLVFYGLGILISNSQNSRRKNLYAVLGVIYGVGMLLYFKYTNFFILSFKELLESFGVKNSLHTLNIIMPFGISYYTFRLLSYVIDLNRGKYEATRNIVTFSTYVAFFPCILSGPIDRPDTLIPQLENKRIFNYNLAVDGLRQILWGIFKKMVIAETLSSYVNMAYSSYEANTGSTLFIAAILFSFVLYTDFSGYSDMAIGIAKVLGFRVTKNFNYPFFAQNIADFWRRWHISLTSWLTDYVFMPLNVKWRNLGNWGMIFAIIINFVIVGLWHEASWNFVIFGFIQGLLYIPLILSGKMFKKVKIETYRIGFPVVKSLGKMIFTFMLVSITFILVRADNLNHAYNFFMNIFNLSLFTRPVTLPAPEVILLIPFIIVEWTGKNKEYPIADLKKKKAYRWLIYLILIVLIGIFMKTEETTFIYFQF